MATGTIIGGCCGGPPGAAFGGMAGVYFGYRTVHDYQPLVTAVREMHDEERARLVHQVQVRRHGRVVSASRVGIGGGDGERWSKGVGRGGQLFIHLSPVARSGKNVSFTGHPFGNFGLPPVFHRFSYITR